MKIYTRNGDKMKTTTFKGQVYKSDLVIEVEGTTNSCPTYQHFVKSKITDDFAIKIFEDEFKSKFCEKLKELGQKITII